MLQFRTAVAVLGGLVLAGCQGNKPMASTSAAPSDVLDIHPAPAMSITPIYVTSSPDAVAAAPGQDAIVKLPAAAGSASGRHVVQRGETLYSIARSSLGDGKKWSQIAMLNPGVQPSSLKIGQTLNMP